MREKLHLFIPQHTIQSYAADRKKLAPSARLVGPSKGCIFINSMFLDNLDGINLRYSLNFFPTLLTWQKTCPLLVTLRVNGIEILFSRKSFKTGRDIFWTRACFLISLQLIIYIMHISAHTNKVSLTVKITNLMEQRCHSKSDGNWKWQHFLKNTDYVIAGNNCVTQRTFKHTLNSRPKTKCMPVKLRPHFRTTVYMTTLQTDTTFVF